MLICPICKNQLIKNERVYVCANTHSFDISKYGHTNLLLSNQKNSKFPGDNKEMVMSRKKFLEKGYYNGISNTVNELLEEHLKFSEKEIQKKRLNILDIGCGEGYYTNNLKKYFSSKNIETDIIGIDISKEAIISASKSYKEIEWFVGSATNLPIESSSLNLILCMFSKIDSKENFRTLKTNGKLAIVSTGENHLVEMKETLYEKVKKDFYLPKDDPALSNFKHIQSMTCSYQVDIKEKESISNLFNMTPYRWRTPEDGIKRLYTLETLFITVEVTIDIFEKI